MNLVHWAPDLVSPRDDEIMYQRNTEPLRDSGAQDDGGLWLLVECQPGLWRAQSPGLLESVLAIMVGLESTHNSLLSHSIHQDILHSYEHKD